MLKIKAKNKRDLINCAMGKIEADLCLTNGQLVNVITGEIYNADIYVYDGFIAHVETVNPGVEIKAKEIIDCNGDFVMPGLIDAHVHIESSMLTPTNFAKGVLNHGTTTVITDPHEVANVLGEAGVRYMHEKSEGLPMRQLINIPSCVPSVVGLENAGASFNADNIRELAKLNRVVGLAEVMDFIGVINCDDRMMDIIEEAEKHDLYLQGHAPIISGRNLSAYAASNIRTCHESRLPNEFVEKMRNGISVDVRESSMIHNAAAAMEKTKNFKFYDFMTVCTDDREASDIIYKGHLNLTVRELIKNGLDPVTAIKSATINNAREIKMDNLGAIAPGYVADIIVCKSIEEVIPNKVFFEGKLVSQNGELTVDIEDKPFEIEEYNSINLELTTPELFKIKAPINNGKVKVNIMSYTAAGGAVSIKETVEVDVVNGYIDLSKDPSLKTIVILNRHGKGTIGYGIVKGFGVTKGAVASTVSHDSHNLTVVFDNIIDASNVVNELIKCKGGISVSLDNKILYTLPLQIAGLLSIEDAKTVAKQSKKMQEVLPLIGLEFMQNPLLRIATCALIVIPEVKMSDLGLIDVFTRTLIPLFAE